VLAKAYQELMLTVGGVPIDASMFNASVPFDRIEILNDTAVRGIAVANNPFHFGLSQPINLSCTVYCSHDVVSKAVPVLNIFVDNLVVKGGR
jgi:hypothetical protein